MLLRAGEPYVTTRSRGRTRKPDEAGGGLGLGLFIAKTLIERSGAQLLLSNITEAGQHGALVRVTWARHVFEREAIAPHRVAHNSLRPLTERDAAPI